MDSFVNKCVEIARLEGFDGYLLNIENPLDSLELVGKMVELTHR